MSRATGKPGRPKASDDSGEMSRITFRLDAETEQALNRFPIDATILIYVLRDPRDGAIRYVGRTNGGLRSRLHGHLRSALRRSEGVIKNAWLDELSELGLVPQIQLIDVVCVAAQDEAEEQWIRSLAANGAKLVNGTFVNSQSVVVPTTGELFEWRGRVRGDRPL